MQLSSKSLKPSILSKLAAEKLRQIKPSLKTGWADFARSTKIRSGSQIIPFDPYDYQIEFVNQILTHYGTVAVKTRQMGFTECVVSLLLYLADSNPSFLGVVFSKSQEDTANIARRCRLMVAGHPTMKLETASLRDLKVKNGGRLVFKPSTPNAARSLESVSFILFDECAFVYDIEEIYGSALPATEMLGNDPITGAKVVILSTPNGRQGFYWQRVNEYNSTDILSVCEQMRQGEIAPLQHWTDNQGWCKFITHWKAHPIYAKRPDYLHTQKVSKRLTDAQVEREYNLGFDASISRVFKDDLLEIAAKGQWQPPKYGRSYLVGIDPSFGGDDFFTVRVWDVTKLPYQLVAQYRDHQKSIDLFISKTIDLLMPYSKSRSLMIGCETNSGGALVQQELQKKRPQWQIECINITNQSKRLHTDRLVLLLERNHLWFPPEPEDVLTSDDPDMANRVGCAEYAHFVEEADTVTRVRNAESGFHDDTVMADAIAFSLIEELPKPITSDASVSDPNPIRSVLSEL